MGNSAKFNRDDVVEKAMNLYWEKGFHATSMRNLQDVVDMRPGSIYATFGSKEGLYKEALALYTDRGISRLLECRSNASSPISALRQFVKQSVIDTRSIAPSGMCMLLKTVSELTNENEELLAAAKQSLKKMESGFEQLLLEAQAMGEIDSNKEAAQLARHVQIQISGLRAYARVADSDLPLEKMIDDIFCHHPF